MAWSQGCFFLPSTQVSLACKLDSVVRSCSCLPHRSTLLCLCDCRPQTVEGFGYSIDLHGPVDFNSCSLPVTGIGYAKSTVRLQ
ncbi:hypothetical protein BCV70DRAFT_196885 [Testicularia cyperi]|uniref:Uncharacterized protein n=1 Tax=Testicularia cyperi TaxID=1882483 RepID=A0A317XWJ3_9BASI|nr:hypothetical protein BCV70DRAFT_196885 [Testicularia cyperi]